MKNALVGWREKVGLLLFQWRRKVQSYFPSPFNYRPGTSHPLLSCFKDNSNNGQRGKDTSFRCIKSKTKYFWQNWMKGILFHKDLPFQLMGELANALPHSLILTTPLEMSLVLNVHPSANQPMR